MTSIPDFSKLPLGAHVAKAAPPAGEPWLTPEGIAASGPVDLNAFRGDAAVLAAFASSRSAES